MWHRTLENRMGRKDAVLRLGLDTEMLRDLDALGELIRSTHQYRVLERLGEQPGLLPRSKVARAALALGMEALWGELEEEARRIEALRREWQKSR